MSVDQFTFETIPFQSSWQLSKGSLGQIMKAFEYTSDKCDRPSNSYEEAMFRQLKVVIGKILEEFKKFLTFDSDRQRDVVWYTLCGYNGRISGQVILDGTRANVRYDKVNFGPLLKGAMQRCQFILQRDVPEMYTKNLIMNTEFNNLREKLDPFHDLLKSLEKEWIAIVVNARTVANVRPRPRPKLRHIKMNLSRYPKRSCHEVTFPVISAQFQPICPMYMTNSPLPTAYSMYNQTGQHYNLFENINNWAPRLNTQQYYDMYANNFNTRQPVSGDFMSLDQLRRERRNALVPGTDEYNQIVNKD